MPGSHGEEGVEPEEVQADKSEAPPCHGGVEVEEQDAGATSEHEYAEQTSKSRGSWKQFFVGFLVISTVLFVASAAAQFNISEPPNVVLAQGATIYYNEACSDCLTYLAGELRPTLEAVGISPIVVKDYINEPKYRQELRVLNDDLGIPFNLQSHIVTFVNGGNLTVLEGHVPADLMLQTLEAANETGRMLVYQDSMGTAVDYRAWGFGGEVRQYSIGTPLSDYVSWFISTRPTDSQQSVSLLPLVVSTGFVDGLNPCAFAVLLFFVSLLYVTRRPRSEVGRMGSLYIYAVFLAYLLIGLGLLKAIMISEDPHLLARVAGVLVAAIGIFVLIQPLFPKIPNPFHMPKFVWERVQKWMYRGTDSAAGVAGFLVGLCTFPCSGGIYVAVLSLIAAKTTYWEGLGYLYLYNIAFILPLVIVLLVVSNRQLARQVTRWERGHTNLVRGVAAGAMVIVGILTVFMV